MVVVKLTVENIRAIWGKDEKIKCGKLERCVVVRKTRATSF